MKNYSWIGGDRPSDAGAVAKNKLDEGFFAAKVNATVELQMVDTYDKARSSSAWHAARTSASQSTSTDASASRS